MGSKFQDYQNTQLRAEDFAKSQRRLRRYTWGYVALSLVSALISLVAGPKFMVLSMITSVGSYCLFRFGAWGYHKAKQWYLNRQAIKEMEQENGSPSAEPLLTQRSRKNLRDFANHDLTQALISKNSRISHYSDRATFSDQEPMSYSDRKHQRALFQYHMLECTKEAALQGDEAFIQEMSHDKSERRQRKLDILKTLLNDYVASSTVFITLKSIKPHSHSDEWVISGIDKSAFLTALEIWNASSPKPFLTIPQGLSGVNKEKFLTQSLLPLLLDAEQVFEKIQPIGKGMEVCYFRAVHRLKNYVVTADYLKQRIAGLEKRVQAPLLAPVGV